MDDASDEINRFADGFANLIGGLEVSAGPGREVAVGEFADEDRDLVIVEGNDEVTEAATACRHAERAVCIPIEGDAGRPKLLRAAVRY